MNKIKYTLLGMAVAVFAGCAGLDYNEASNRDEDWTYNSPLNGVKALVYDVYAQMPSEFKDNSYGNGALIASATDESEFALSFSPIHKYFNGGWTPSNPFSTTWDRSYRAITQVHMYLERIHKIDLSDYEYDPDYQTMVQQFEIFPYELRFLRAYFYFELVRAYGDVPLVTTALTNEQANSVERTPAKDVFKFIINELDAVAEYLPVSYNDIPGQEIGRATRGAALALKARALLYQASPLFNTDNNKELWKEAAAAIMHSAGATNSASMPTYGGTIHSPILNLSSFLAPRQATPSSSTIILWVWRTVTPATALHRHWWTHTNIRPTVRHSRRNILEMLM